MEKIPIYFVAVFLIASASAILNGERSPNQPYYARITFRLTEGNQQEIHNKAGAIITRTFVLTTGFFIANSQDHRVWVGSSIRENQVGHNTVGMIRIPSSLPDAPALIQLLQPLVFTRDVQAIRLVPFNLRVGLENEQGMVVGMGGTSVATRGDLQAAFLRITSSQLCAINYPNRNSTAFLCAYDGVRRTDFCSEDRGSALSILSRGKEFLVGIAIEGVCNAAQHNRPSAFINIEHFRDIINNIIEGIQSTA